MKGSYDIAINILKYNLPITIEVLNQILVTNSLNITKIQLDQLLNIPKVEEIIFGLNIHYTSIINCIKENKPFFNPFYFYSTPINNAKEKVMSLDELLILIEKERLNNKKGRKLLLNSMDGKTNISFNSIQDCLIYLNSIAPSFKTTLYRYIESGEPYYGFICNWEGESNTNHSFKKGIEISITDIETKKVVKINSIRKAALWFNPNTTGQTVKSYLESGKLFRNKFHIEYNNSNAND